VKWVTIICKPFKVEDVVRALAPLDVGEVLVSEVRGYGRQKGHLELYVGSEYEITFLPKVKLELCVDEFKWKAIASAVEEVARTGRIGDGKLFVETVKDVYPEAAPGPPADPP